MTLKHITKQTNNKFLNMYLADFETPRGNICYQFASRKPEHALVMVAPKSSPDAVRMIPYFLKDGKTFVVLIQEFRFPVNRYLYGVPAGLVDDNESPFDSVKRELMEEIGAETIEITQTEPVSFTSAGMSDESIICFEAQVNITSNQSLEGTEDIKRLVVDLETLEQMLDEEEFGLQSRLQLKNFLLKQKLKQLSL